MKLLFCHGWAFDAGFWDRLRPLLARFEQAADDRGYFGAASAPRIEGACVAVTHSHGTMRLLADPPAGLAGLVAVNGFTRFAGSDDESDAGVPRRVLDLMLRRLERDPAATVAQFRAECGCADPHGAPDRERLRVDLLDLRDGEAPMPQVPVLSLEGEEDHLLAAPWRERQFGGAAERRVQPGAGHLLPRDHAGWCAEAIAAFAGRLA